MTTKATSDVLSAVAKGSIVVGTAAGSATDLSVGNDGQFLEADSASTAGMHWGGPSRPFEGRLTLTSALPVTTADVTAATNIYLTPYKGNKVSLYDGSAWRVCTLTEQTLAVPATTSQMYDVFAFLNGTAVNIEALAWTNDTTRATALVMQDGNLCKTGALTRRYVGSFRTTTVSGQTEDSKAKRYVWNHYNRMLRQMLRIEPTASWSQSPSTIRQANASASNQLDFIVGWSEDIVKAQAHAGVANTAASGYNLTAIGLDSTTTIDATNCTFGYDFQHVTGNPQSQVSEWTGFPGVGRHILVWLEATSAGTATWYGTTTSAYQSGIRGEILG